MTPDLPAPAVVVIDPTVRYQKWEGWGTSLAWWAHIVGSYPEPIRSQLIQRVLGDLQLNILRYNIGGGEDPKLPTMEPRARVPGFLRADGTYDWTADEAQRFVLQLGKKLGADRFEAFSNSPPYFMTISGSVTGADGGGDNLRPDSVDAFTAYMATVVKQFKSKWGIEFSTLAPMNEPGAPWWKLNNRQEGCHVAPGERQSELILATRRALDAAGLKTQISATDESWNNWAVTSWDALSPEARQTVDQFSTHCYGGNAQHEVNVRATRDRKRLWMSEYGDGDASGMTLARQIVRDIRIMQPTAWVYWQIIDNGGGWGCLDLDINHRSTEAVTNRKFYAFSQFTKYLRPGCRFISIGDDHSVAARNGNELTIVAVSDSDRDVTYDLSRFAGARKVRKCIRTSPTEDAASVDLALSAPDALTVHLPKDSVTTIVIADCRVPRS